MCVSEGGKFSIFSFIGKLTSFAHFLEFRLKLTFQCKPTLQTFFPKYCLRILTGKKHPQIKLKCLLKVLIWTFG